MGITPVLRVNPDDFAQEELAPAGRILREGGLVVFPTETVYGLGRKRAWTKRRHAPFIPPRAALPTTRSLSICPTCPGLTCCAATFQSRRFLFFPPFPPGP